MTYTPKTKSIDFSELKGKILTKIDNRGDELLFTTTDGKTYRQIYYDDCCASCSVEEIHGDLQDLIGTPILMAEKVSSSDPSPEVEAKRAAQKAERAVRGERDVFFEDSETWTFYKAATIKGGVTIRWYGSSNGYYSESPTFEEIL